MYRYLFCIFTGNWCALRRGPGSHWRDVRVLSDLLPRLEALGRHPHHEAAAAGLRGEEGSRGHRCHVLQPIAGTRK